MRKRMMQRLAAAAAVAWAVMPLPGYSPIENGDEGTIAPARRAQAPQIGKNDVVLDDTSGQQCLRRQTPDPSRKDHGVRKAVNQLGFRVALRDARFGEAMASATPCPKWLCGSNSPVVDGAEIVAQPDQVRPARRHQAQQLTGKDVAVGDTIGQQPRRQEIPDALRKDHGVRKAVNQPGFRVAVRDARFGETMATATIPCPKWLCGSNSPVVDGAEIVAQPDQVRPARRHRAQQLTKKDVAVGDKNGQQTVGKQTPNALRKDHAVRKAVNQAGFRVAVRDARFGEAFGQNLNSPVVDGAEILAQADQVRPGRRHQAQQLTEKDVAVYETPAQASVQKRTFDRPRNAEHIRKALTRPGLNAAAQGARFGESFGLNLNSPIVDGTAAVSGAFHELNLAGAPNAAGFAVAAVRKGDTAYDLEVRGASVTAHPRGRTAPRLTGAALSGLVLDLRDARGGQYALRIAGSGTTTYWAGAPDLVPTYTLTYTSAAQPAAQPLCTAGVNEAILFAGDRYDAAHKTVTATGAATRGWVNIACASTALAKLYLVRHTEASQAVPTTQAERQAMFKMFTGDYCGDGTPFTVHGQPLLWADAKAITKFAETPASFEAVWNENGAVCLDQPRRPEMATAMRAHCPQMPRCTPEADGHVISANPR